MDGIIIVNKEKNMTSHDVISRLRKILNTKKIGHIGTLDPLAEGVLVVCVGNATKLVQFLEGYDKVYQARVCIGKSSTTYDLEGKIVEQVKISSINEDEIDYCLEKFVGTLKQKPPIYSAIKINGEKLYNYARKNIEVEIPSRDVTIHSIKRISSFSYEDDCLYFTIEAKVSKGTYIRSLCYDIGQSLNLPSLMASLTRTAVGPFTLDQAFTLTDIEKGNYKLYNMLDTLSNYQMIEDERIIHYAQNGRMFSVTMIDKLLNDMPKILVIAKQRKLIAIYEKNDDFYKAVRVWN